MVYCDASKMSLGGVLMHTSQVLAYAYEKLKVHERHYLFGSRYEVFSDHKSLKYLFDQNELNTRHMR